MKHNESYALEIEVEADFLEKFKAAAKKFWAEKSHEDLLALLKEKYETADVKVYFEPETSPCYLPTNKMIFLDKYSLVSFLHEFRHHWQHDKQKNVSNEIDARVFSASLYKKAFPILYKKMAAQGRLLYR